MTNLLTSAVLSALSITYQPDIRTAYWSRGRVSEDRPVQSNLLRLNVSLDDFGNVGVWHWHYNSLTDRPREKRDCQLAESDWAVFYNYDLELAEDWKLKTEVMIRWFTFMFYHEPYKGDSDHSRLEFYVDQQLENPYITPTFRMRRSVRAGEYLYFRVGVKRTFPVDWFDSLEGLSVTPAFYVDFGDDNQLSRYGEHPHGKDWSSGIMSGLAELTVSYPLSDHFTCYATLQQGSVLNDDARAATHSPQHKDYTIFTIGMKCQF